MLTGKIKRILKQYSKIQTSSFIGEIDNLKYRVENNQDEFNVCMNKNNLGCDFYFNKKDKSFELDLFLHKDSGNEVISLKNYLKNSNNDIVENLKKILKEYEKDENKNSNEYKIVIKKFGANSDVAKTYTFKQKKRHTDYLESLDKWEKESDKIDFLFK